MRIHHLPGSTFIVDHLGAPERRTLVTVKEAMTFTAGDSICVHDEKSECPMLLYSTSWIPMPR